MLSSRLNINASKRLEVEASSRQAWEASRRLEAVTSQHVPDRILGKCLGRRVLVEGDLAQGLPLGWRHADDDLHPGVGALSLGRCRLRGWSLTMTADLP